MATGGADKVVKVWSWRPALGVWGRRHEEEEWREEGE